MFELQKGEEAGMEKMADEELHDLYSSPDYRTICEKVPDQNSCITELLKKTDVRKLQCLSFTLICPLEKYGENVCVWIMMFYQSNIIFTIILNYMHLLQAITDLLLKGVQFPYYCAKAMMEGQALFQVHHVNQLLMSSNVMYQL